MVILEDVDLAFAARDINLYSSSLGDLLDRMDGLRPSDDVGVILTTNSIERLEAAIKDRPGRISQCVYFGPPGETLRRRYLEQYAEGYDCTATDLERLVAMSDGTTPAFIKEWVHRTVQIATEDLDGPAPPPPVTGRFSGGVRRDEALGRVLGAHRRLPPGVTFPIGVRQPGTAAMLRHGLLVTVVELRKSREAEVLEANPVLFIRRAVVALDAHPVVGWWRKFACRGGLELGVALRAILGLPGISGNQQAQSDAPGRHRLPAGDDVELAVDEFLDLLEHRFAVVVPGDSRLLVLLRGKRMVGNRYFDGECAFAAVWGLPHQRILDGCRHTGFDAYLQPAIANAPTAGILPQPPPAFAQLAGEVVFEDDLVVG